MYRHRSPLCIDVSLDPVDGVSRNGVGKKIDKTFYSEKFIF